MTDDLNAPATKADLLQLEARLAADWREQMIGQTRWLAALFVAQFIATFGATVAAVSFLLRSIPIAH